MNQPRISVPTLLTVIVAVATMGLLVAPARATQGGRRASARLSRTAPRLDAADAAVHDTDHHVPASAVARGRLVASPTAPSMLGATPRLSRLAQLDQVPAILIASRLVARDNRAGLLRPGAALRLTSRVPIAAAGRGPPAV